MINKLYNSVDEHNYNSLIYLFEIGKFSPEEKTRFILNIKPINNSKVIVKLKTFQTTIANHSQIMEKYVQFY